MMENIKADEISKIIRQQIEGFQAGVTLTEVGTVVKIGDGIAEIHGLEKVMAGELLDLPHKVAGIALNLEEDKVGAVIIGDRQTGKTAVAIDTIINSKGKDLICIYIAIGQKKSTVAQVVEKLKQFDAMDYTIIVTASASDPAAMQYIAPYSGCAIGEFF